MKIFKTIYYIVVALIAMIALLLIISVLPVTGNYKVLTVLSGSMEPSIKTGSVVIVKSVDKYKIGDVITFGAKTKIKTPVTHRIYDIKVVEGKVFYITKGDANDAPDLKEISQKEIIGKVLFSVPYLGYAVETAKKPIGFMSIIIVPAVLIIYDEFRKIIREVQKSRQKAKINRSKDIDYLSDKPEDNKPEDKNK